MSADKYFADDASSEDFAKYFRDRAEGHAPGYYLAIYAKPHFWRAVADALDKASAVPPAQRQGEAQ